jgi:DNA polymerase-3 subunit gamma/tau
MSYQVLARKWRPQNFNDVVGQAHVVRVLTNSIKNNQIAHAYLLCGTRGTGKTTLARIFAKAINCTNLQADGNPCQQCLSCTSFNEESYIDYQEIDGASNNSVDDIRALNENVLYLPTSGKYKIYVIDEVHMLSNNAFNALLKTLEEPPAHVIFIFATTEPNKLLRTVLSRCQRLDLRNASHADISEHLKKICHLEGLKFSSPEILEAIARRADGSFRDALSLLDQARALSVDNMITSETIVLALGIASKENILNLLDYIFACQSEPMTELYLNIMKQNIDINSFATQILEELYYIIQRNEFEGDISELYWIYEVMAKDFEWIIKNSIPEKSLLLVLQKIAKRDELFEDKKKNLLARKQITSTILTWPGCLNYLKKESSTAHAALEHAVLIHFNINELEIVLGFTEENNLFLEYFQDKTNWQSLNLNINQYFEKSMNLKLISLARTEKENKNLLTPFEKQENESKDEEEKKRKQILENPYIIDVQNTFNIKIKKVTIKE